LIACRKDGRTWKKRRFQQRKKSGNAVHYIIFAEKTIKRKLSSNLGA
jgi:hypothetical protein